MPQHAAAGQATPSTHPHLLARGELTPGVSFREYRDRRRQLVDSFLSDGSFSAAVVAASPTKILSGVIPLPYRPDSSFFYLTGVTAPGPVALIERDDGGSGDGCIYTLFVPQQTSEDVRWDGRTLTLEAAVDVFGAHEAYPLTMLEHVLKRKKLDGGGGVVADVERLRERGLMTMSPTLARYCGSGSGNGGGGDPRLEPKVSLLRWRKSEAELEVMRRAAAISADAFNACIGPESACVAGASEDEVMARFQYECHRRGARHMAYPPVCASGANSVAVHYNSNDQLIKRGDLFLMDAGCELHGYCSDITRTWSVDGRCSSAQRAVVDIVLHTLKVCTDAIGGEENKGQISLHDLHMMSVVELSRGLIDLGVCKGTVSSVVNKGSYRPYYPHSIGHWLGLDTHDTPSVPSTSILEPGVVLTLEPGLYFGEDTFGNSVPKYLRGIGVRIEDDIIVGGDGGGEVITLGVPRDLEQQ